MFGWVAFGPLPLLLLYDVVVVTVFVCFDCWWPPTGGNVAGNGGGSSANRGKVFVGVYFKIAFNSKRARLFMVSSLKD